MNVALPTKKLHKLAEDLVNPEPDAFIGKVTVDQIKIIMVEAGIIPANVADDDCD